MDDVGSPTVRQRKAVRSQFHGIGPSTLVCIVRSVTAIRVGLAIGCLALTLLAGSRGALADESVVITNINGERTTANLKGMTDDRLLVETDPAREIPQNTIRSLEFDHPVLKRSSGPLIWLANGDRMAARPVEIKNDILSVDWPVLDGGTIDPIPLERIAAVIFDLPATIGDRMRLFADLETLPAGSDLVMLLNGDRSLGEIQQLDAAFLELKTGNSVLKLDRSRIRALRMNPELTNASRNAGRRTIVTLTDGSRLTATSLEATEAALTLKSPFIMAVKLLWKDVHDCHLYGERIIPLSDYVPQTVEFVPYLSTTWDFVRNANVRHGPLMLRGTEYVSGLGTHSRMTISYDLKGGEKEFQAVVGVDDIANGAGSVVFAIDLDGERAWTSPEVTGKSAPLTVPSLSLKGRKRLTLLVDFGQFADVSDYADWCDPVLILDGGE